MVDIGDSRPLLSVVVTPSGVNVPTNASSPLIEISPPASSRYPPRRMLSTASASRSRVSGSVTIWSTMYTASPG